MPFTPDATSTQTGTEEGDVYEDESYYFADVVFLVEDWLFKVPRQYFEDGSEVFRDMFQLHVPENVVPEGLSKEKPIRLEGIDKRDFKQLLRVMYPLCFGREELLTVLEWTSVLKLSTMWDFAEIRKLAVQRMSALGIEATEKIVLARDYRVAKWLVPALNDLARREEPLGELEVKLLGWDYVLKMAQVRESYPPASRGQYCGSCGRFGESTSTRGQRDFTAAIERVFAKDLEEVMVCTSTSPDPSEMSDLGAFY